MLTVENPYIAKAKLKRLNRYLPVSVTHLEEKREIDDMYWDAQVKYEPVFNLGSNIIESIKKLKQVEELTEHFPDWTAVHAARLPATHLLRILSAVKLPNMIVSISLKRIFIHSPSSTRN